MSESDETYYVFAGGQAQVLGPFRVQELQDLARAKSLTEDWQFTRAGEERWKPFKGSPLWQSIRPAVIFKDEMIGVLPPPRQRLSQRTKDYFKLLVIVNLACASLKFFIVINPASLMFLAALFLICNVMLIWTMFFILRRY